MEDVVDDRCMNLMTQRSRWRCVAISLRVIIFLLSLLYTNDITGYDMI